LTVRPVEPDAAVRERVHVRGLDVIVTVTAHCVVALLIGTDPQHVRSLIGHLKRFVVGVARI
jgi:hypothetical protein